MDVIRCGARGTRRVRLSERCSVQSMRNTRGRRSHCSCRECGRVRPHASVRAAAYVWVSDCIYMWLCGLESCGLECFMHVATDRVLLGFVRV